MEAYQRTVEEALQEQHSSMHGLSEAQAQERSSVFGLNKLQEEKKASLLKRLARQLSNPMIIVLLGLRSFPESPPHMHMNPMRIPLSSCLSSW